MPVSSRQSLQSRVAIRVDAPALRFIWWLARRNTRWRDKHEEIKKKIFARYGVRPDCGSGSKQPRSVFRTQRNGPGAATQHCLGLQSPGLRISEWRIGWQ